MLTTYNSLLSLSDITLSYHNITIFYQILTLYALEDPFKPAVERVMRTEVKDGYKKSHEQAFKPAKTVPEKIYKASFEHMSDRVEVKKNYRDADGKVELEPKNFYTWNPKKGKVGKRCFFNGQVEHMPDDYNWPKKEAMRELQEAKKLEQEKPFS